MNNDDRHGRLVKVAAKPFAFALLFCLGLSILEFILMPQTAASEVFNKHVANRSFLRLAIFLSLPMTAIVLSLLVIYGAVASRIMWRAVFTILFALTTFGEYGYHRAFGRFSTFLDLEVAIFSTNYQIFSNAAAMYFNPIAVVPVIVLIGASVYFRRERDHGSIFAAAVFAAIVIFFGATAYFTKTTFHTNASGAGMRTLVKLPVVWYLGTSSETPRIKGYAARREPVAFRSAGSPGNNIILVVDESVRGDRLSINGNNIRTTPLLENLEQRGLLTNWGIAASGTTCSGTSNNLLLTGLRDLPDPDYRVFKLPTIFAYARAMNYRTHYFDGQVSGVWNGKAADIPDFGNWVRESDLIGSVSNKYEIDGEIGRRVREIASTSTGNFIWINKFGIHKPYTDSYPAPPEEPRDQYKGIYLEGYDRETLLRQYDAALQFNSQLFFESLVGDSLPANTIVIYTSDHGQTLSEHGESASHCADSRNEANVPLFVIAEDPRVRAADTGYRAAHQNLFATILDLMEFPDESRGYQYAPSLLRAKTADSRPRFYFSGDLQGKDGGRLLPFD